ncbi:NAD kinase-like isoform X1 [Topomyia yanbarensis]|uniref:NAD kinase-like isoform X1 n=1 Tax=Topomyia yanbarensis TaxID=2498891 RepID=UPI00273CA190|nr:NAD kinase-like isoform X1 [Topomyia yanbarensis]XP_058837576.1 NAD kinase-like isoform X1 [Topomyia yanbarensis]XP_058837577.1 NAD kinase-like isoform X1 [Topomyia yanbarensis]XP_058837578.1 NAD kinase-like isoform X1 [Topomyia yanbarensis]XP_058837580.1 NAD kinase-like isoform X1 [Topomyia yanbarensis]
MAYLSDIDLATLHRSRLEERVHYKLSSWHRSATMDGNMSKSPAQSKPTRTASTASVGTSTRSGASATIDDIINNNELEPVYSSGRAGQQQKSSGGTCDVNTLVHLGEARSVTSNRRTGAGWHQSNVHVIKRRSRNSISCSSTGTSSSSNGIAGNTNYKHVEWSDDDYLNDDGYFSSETRRRRSGTWPRTRSLNAPSPFQQFGPCGRIMKNSAMVMQIQDPASQRLTWYKPPLAVLVIKKVRDSKVLQPFVELVEWLIQEKHMVVWVEGAILDDPLLTGDKRFTKIQDKLITFKDGRDDLTDKIDFIICLGGDGTLLYASLLFQKSVPPVMAFHLGSLGFLTPFQFNNFQEQVTNVLEGHAALTLRSRLRCIIVRKDKTEQEISTFRSSQDPTTNILVLNEVVIDRGLSSYLSNIDLFLDGKHITSVQGDGLIVSTPTGSTAYSAAAGASMIHPSVPAILVTPICPHSLSFRPIVLPAGVELKIALSPDSRNSSWVSFDGRNRQELLHGDSLHVTTSIYPVPSICAQDQIADWFDSLAECLHWNVRKRQKCLDELSDLTGSGTEDSALEEIDRGMENLES